MCALGRAIRVKPLLPKFVLHILEYLAQIYFCNYQLFDLVSTSNYHVKKTKLFLKPS